MNDTTSKRRDPLPADDWLAEFRTWIAEHKDDPAVIAGCERVGRLLRSGMDSSNPTREETQ